MPIEIYHNPRCSKSRATLALLRERDIEPQIVAYLEQPPSLEELRSIVNKLGIAPSDLVRTGEAAYKQDRDAIDAMNDAEKLAWLTRHPRVIQRPIVINGDRARIGRPPESVLEIL